MPYVKMTIDQFMKQLTTGRYASVTAARRAVGKMGLPGRETASAYAAVNACFDKRAAPRAAAPTKVSRDGYARCRFKAGHIIIPLSLSDTVTPFIRTVVCTRKNVVYLQDGHTPALGAPQVGVPADELEKQARPISVRMAMRLASILKNEGRAAAMQAAAMLHAAQPVDTALAARVAALEARVQLLERATQAKKSAKPSDAFEQDLDFHVKRITDADGSENRAEGPPSALTPKTAPRDVNALAACTPYFLRVLVESHLSAVRSEAERVAWFGLKTPESRGRYVLQLLERWDAAQASSNGATTPDVPQP